MRTLDATVHNMIGNHPDVVRSLGWKPEDHPETEGWLLFGNLIEPDMLDTYYLLHNEAQTLGMIFEWNAPGVFQMHSMSLPGCRGRTMMGDAKALIHEMFVEYQADLIWGQTPIDNLAARMFNRLIGARSCGFREHHVMGKCELFRNSRAQWLADHWSKPSA